ncbi:hypothetical protein SeMB42_g01701 [Synchytrium endobioticum]|uniref:Uncharacterized protein n=1 Tax=Synchytrium endobioticum TaxID=286115 RepID=A0A507DJX6_9FUNG|nr:hypothetical protein SeLEV6574_g03882 [Synchytrium endobioticum]TPX52009.1 hypothetical protein SeMB42_g01701 [Synchytrium endobioticum]
MLNNISISNDSGPSSSANITPSSISKPEEASSRTSGLGKLIPAIHASSRTSTGPLYTHHTNSRCSVDPLIREVGTGKDHGSHKKSSNDAKDPLSPSSATPSYLKPMPFSGSPSLTPTTTKNPFDAIYNNPGSWSQGAFVTAANKRKKSRKLKLSLAVGFGLLLLLGVSLIVFFCYPRNPSIRVTTVRNATEDIESMAKLQSNPAMATFNFTMVVRIASSNYLKLTIDDMTCFGYHPLQPVNVIATSVSFTNVEVEPQSKIQANTSLSISLVSPITSAAVFTEFLAGCGLVGINSGLQGPQNMTTNATVGTITTANGTMLNVPQVVDRPRNRLLFRCTTLWSVGATTKQTEFDSTVTFNCPVHFESTPNLNRTFVFAS